MYIEITSWCCKISISSGMDYLSFYCRCLVLILTWMSCSSKVLVERRIDVVSWFCGSLRGAWQTTGINGSNKNACLSSNV